MTTSSLRNLIRNPGLLSTSALLGALHVLSGCAGEDSANGEAEAINRSTGALVAANLASVNGTYGDDCTNRSGQWSLPIAGGATLDAARLSVVLNDTGCVLTLTELHTADGALEGSPAITLATSYAATPSSFLDPIEFYANAQLSSALFAADFVVNIVYSDDAALASAESNTAQFAVVESSASASSVLSPDYTIDMSGLDVLTDTNDAVVSATGGVELTADDVLGQTYVVADASGLSTFAEYDDAYEAGTPAALPVSPLLIPASAFTLFPGDLTIPEVRTLIIANIVEGVPAYQAFEITFNPAL